MIVYPETKSPAIRAPLRQFHGALGPLRENEEVLSGSPKAKIPCHAGVTGVACRLFLLNHTVQVTSVPEQDFEFFGGLNGRLGEVLVG